MQYKASDASDVSSKRTLRELENLRNLEIFCETILNNDSCFFFSLLNVQKPDNRILGVKRDGRLEFIDDQGTHFFSIDELIQKKMGSHEYFLECYINDITKALYFSGTRGIKRDGKLQFVDDQGTHFFSIDELIQKKMGTHKYLLERYINDITKALYFSGNSNGLFTVSSKEDAINILRNDYSYKYFFNPSDTVSAVNDFVDQISQLRSLSKEKKQELFFTLKQYISSSESSISLPEAEAYLRQIRKFDYFPLMTQNVSSIIKKFFTQEEYDELCRSFACRRQKVNSAYHFISELLKSQRRSLKDENLVSPNDKYPYLCDRYKYILNEIVFK